MTVSTKDKNSRFWTHPVVLGLMLGLLLIGPDHLGTLMALSTLTTGIESFRVGFAWGFGHSLGMILIIPMFLLVRELSSKKFDFEQWEYLGDYLVGVSMVLLALYFAIYESRYLTKLKDGTFQIKECACHSTATAHKADPETHHSTNFCSDYSEAPCCKTKKAKGGGKKARLASPGSIPSDDVTSDSSAVEDTPLLQEAEAVTTGKPWLNIGTAREIQGAALGALQGLCCPMGLASIGFMGRIGITASPIMLCMFGAVFVSASALGSGAITLAWGTLTTSGSGKWLSPRTVYMSSCIATFLLGVLWITANACGLLENLNFSEKMIHERMGTHHTNSMN